MLVKIPASQLWVRPPRVRVSRRSFSIALQRQFQSTSIKTQVMFKKAIDHHTTSKGSQGPDARIFSSSSQASGTAGIDKPLFGASSSQHNMPSAPLQRTSQSSLNALDKRPLGAKPAVKRTASGLAKAFDRSHDPFLETSGSPTVPTTQTMNDGSTASLAFFDENDFDSDLDLEVEEPTKKSVAHKKTSPKIPTYQPVTYQQQQRASLHSFTDSQHQTNANSQSQPSSLPLPWSSSPASHKDVPPPIYRRNEETSTISHPSSKPSNAEARPTKRRTLPWLAEKAEHTQEVGSGNVQILSTSKPQAVAEKVSTPASKSTSTQQYPWNTTASAIKAQQRQHRKESKKPTMKTSEDFNEGQATSTANAKRNTVIRPLLSNEQRRVLDLVTEQGKSVFFTGSAGTGKSVLLREIIAVLRKKYQRESDRVAMTASTGLAACNIGGVTLHSFAGIGLGKEPVPELVKKIKRNQKARHRWMRTKVLIIDEISMVDAELFDKLEEIARSMRGNGRAFGGIQLVITGDFFQLPPVPEHGARVSKFSFDATTWTNSIDHTIALHHVFRQKDPVFASMLNEMREGYLSPESQRAFKGLSREIDYGDSLMATELFPRRNEVDTANLARMRQLVGTSQIFEARDGGTIVDKGARDKLLSNCMAPAVIELKKGAQVMLIKNTDETLVNGTLGHVIGFMNEATFDSYNADEEGYHTIQNSKDDELNPQELRQKRQMQLTASTGHIYPLVRFSISDGTTRDVLCTRENWKIELPNGEVQASRSQIPLILAWALSIHKAQGQTLERVKVDLRNVFEKGQAYVALSRATSMKGLQVLGFDPAKVMAHERVRQFYSSLTRAEKIGDEDLKLEVEDAANRERKKKAGNITAYA